MSPGSFEARKDAGGSAQGQRVAVGSLAGTGWEVVRWLGGQWKKVSSSLGATKGLSPSSEHLFRVGWALKCGDLLAAHPLITCVAG